MRVADRAQIVGRAQLLFQLGPGEQAAQLGGELYLARLDQRGAWEEVVERGDVAEQVVAVAREEELLDLAGVRAAVGEHHRGREREAEDRVDAGGERGRAAGGEAALVAELAEVVLEGIAEVTTQREERGRGEQRAHHQHDA
jgi:hypothetical protein